MTQASRAQITSIEEFGSQILEMKQTLKEKVKNLAKQTEMYQVEL